MITPAASTPESPPPLARLELRMDSLHPDLSVRATLRGCRAAALGLASLDRGYREGTGKMRAKRIRSRFC